MCLPQLPIPLARSFSLLNKVLKLLLVYDTVIIIIVLILSCTAGESQSEKIDTAQSTSAEATDLGTY